MAKFEKIMTGDFDKILEKIEKEKEYLFQTKTKKELFPKIEKVI